MLFTTMLENAQHFAQEPQGLQKLVHTMGCNEGSCTHWSVGLAKIGDLYFEYESRWSNATATPLYLQLARFQNGLPMVRVGKGIYGGTEMEIFRAYDPKTDRLSDQMYTRWNLFHGELL